MPTDERTVALPALSRQRVLLFSVLWLLAIAPFFLLHVQWITGPFVNAVLILTCVLLGPMEAIIVGLFPSAIALTSGLLPLPFAPMVPFIMISNAIYVGVFQAMRWKPMNPTKPRKPTIITSLVSLDSSFIAILFASLLKFVFLLLTAKFLVAPLLSGPIVATLIMMMGWPQLITALVGGFVGLVLLSPFKNRERSH